MGGREGVEVGGVQKRAHLITHARYNGRVPVGGQACDRFQGERASGSYKSDDIVLEMHIRRESWRTSTRAGGVATQSGGKQTICVKQMSNEWSRSRRVACQLGRIRLTLSSSAAMKLE